MMSCSVADAPPRIQAQVHATTYTFGTEQMHDVAYAIDRLKHRSS